MFRFIPDVKHQIGVVETPKYILTNENMRSNGDGGVFTHPRGIPRQWGDGEQFGDGYGNGMGCN